MVLVRGHDAYTAVAIGEQTVDWNTAASGTYYRVPLLNEGLTLERETFPKSREFGTQGALEFVEPGRSMVRGHLTVQPRYDGQWFHILMAHAMGSETLISDEWVTGFDLGDTTPVGYTHGYIFASALPNGLTIRVWKSGRDNSGYGDQFIGCMIHRMVWEQPEDDIARVTFEFVGKSVTTSTSTGWGTPPTAGGTVFLKARDLSNTDAVVLTGADLTQANAAQNIRSWRLTMDRHIEADPAFLNAPDTVEQPGVVDTRDVLFEFGGQLEQTYGDTFKPWTEFLAKTQSRADVTYTSTSLLGTANPKTYAFRLHTPALVWEEVTNPLSEGGPVPFSARGRSIQGTVDSTLDPDVSGSTVIATGATTDLRIFGVDLSSSKHSSL